MASSFARTLAAIAIASASYASASVTVYATTGTAAAATPTQCIGAVPCDGSVLTPVGPQQNMSTTVPVQLFTGGMTGLSIRQNGHFAGFSLELSVIDHLCSLLILYLFYKPSKPDIDYSGQRRRCHQSDIHEPDDTYHVQSWQGATSCGREYTRTSNCRSGRFTQGCFNPKSPIWH